MRPGDTCAVLPERSEIRARRRRETKAPRTAFLDTASPLPQLCARLEVVRADGSRTVLWDRRGARA